MKKILLKVAGLNSTVTHAVAFVEAITAGLKAYTTKMAEYEASQNPVKTTPE